MLFGVVEQTEIPGPMLGKQRHVCIILTSGQVRQKSDSKQISQFLCTHIYLSWVLYPIEYLYKHISNAYKIMPNSILSILDIHNNP